MELLPIGSITVFTNVNRGDLYLDDQTINLISDTIVERISKDLEENFKDPQIQVVSYTTARGCILTWITLALVLRGTHKFLTEYEDLRKGITLLLDDIKNKFIKVDRTAVKSNSDKPKELNAKILDQLPKEIQEAIQNADRLAVTTEMTHTTYHKIAIMRNDIMEIIEVEKTDKKITKTDGKSKPG